MLFVKLMKFKINKKIVLLNINYKLVIQFGYK